MLFALCYLLTSEIKSSSIDPLPANIFKENLEVLLPVLVDIVNASLSSGSIDGAKLAHITPLIKGQGLDSDNLKNYRPISNLSFCWQDDRKSSAQASK